ncbi:MAG: hypothetical protein ACFCUN_00660 [Hyphomicrobiaceae bacterium]
MKLGTLSLAGAAVIAASVAAGHLASIEGPGTSAAASAQTALAQTQHAVNVDRRHWQQVAANRPGSDGLRTLKPGDTISVGDDLAGFTVLAVERATAALPDIKGDVRPVDLIVVIARDAGKPDGQPLRFVFETEGNPKAALGPTAL